MLSRRGLLAGGLAQGRRRPNLLFIMADDHAGYVLGADGNRQAATPNLDALARESVRFAAHYCNSPVCTPSRQGLLCGQMPHATGVTLLRTPLPENRETLSARLRTGGWSTAVFGKMHFNQPGRPGLHGFDLAMTEDQVNRAWQAEGKPDPVPEGVETQKLPWRPFQTGAAEWLNARTLPYPRREAQMRGRWVADAAGKWLEQHRGDPFALWVSFQEPHSPFDFPYEDRGRFRGADFRPPAIGREDAAQIPNIFRTLSEEQRAGIIASYYSSAAFLDRNIGRVLRKLEELGLAEHTLVVYTADHGYCLGHHGRFEKHCGYDPALRVPLLVRQRGLVAPRVVREFTEHMDVAPSVLEWMGLDPLQAGHGQSLTPYWRGRRAASPRTHIVSEYLENEDVYVRDARWKLTFSSGRRARQDGYLTENPTPGRTVRLYDLKADPEEYTNAATSHPREVRRLTQLALERFRRTHPEANSEPRGAAPEEALEFYLRPRDVTGTASERTR